MSKFLMLFVGLFTGANAFAMNCNDLTNETQLAFEMTYKYADRATDGLSSEVTKESCAAAAKYLEYEKDGVTKMMNSLSLQFANVEKSCPQATFHDGQQVLTVTETIEIHNSLSLALEMVNDVIEQTHQSCVEAGL